MKDFERKAFKDTNYPYIHPRNNLFYSWPIGLSPFTIIIMVVPIIIFGQFTKFHWTNKFLTPLWHQMFSILVKLLLPLMFQLCSKRKFYYFSSGIHLTATVALVPWHHPRSSKLYVHGFGMVVELIDQYCHQISVMYDTNCRYGKRYDAPMIQI